MYESYLKLTSSQLHMHLLKRKLHPSEMRQIKDDVAAMKETIRVARIARTHRKAEWAHLMKPLQYELNNAKVGRAYDLTDDERVEAFDAHTLLSWKSSIMFCQVTSQTLSTRPYNWHARRMTQPRAHTYPTTASIGLIGCLRGLNNPYTMRSWRYRTKQKQSARYPSNAQSRRVNTHKLSTGCGTQPRKN